MVSTNEEVVSEVAPVEKVTTEIKSISEEDFEKAQKTFQLGKKNLLLNKYAESVNNIEEACKVYSNKYGELDPQCAEIYYFFGRALLELARVENTVLGNALNGVPEDTGPIDDSRYGNPDEVAADEKDEIAEKVIDALCNNEEGQNGKEEEKKEMDEKMKTEETPNKEETKEEAGKCEENKAETMEEKPKPSEETPAPAPAPAEAKETTEMKPEEATTEKTESAAKEGEGEEEEDGGDEEENDEEDEDISKNEDGTAKDEDAEDISNLQRSWEMFELAKLIYQKNFNEDMAMKNKRIAECLLKLGEISIEQEIYEQAINDIKESIRLQEEQKENERDERILAESYYQLGLAQQFNNMFTEANESYQKSINILQIRIEKLRGKLLLVTGEGDDAQLEKNTINDEIGELETLLPELNSKLEEVNEQGQQSLNLIKEAKECFINSMNGNGTAANGEFKATNGECKDITSLMKSKRKISSSEEISNLKKTRLSGGGEMATEEAMPENGTTPATEETTTTPATTNGDENKIQVDEPKPEATEPAKVEEATA